MSCSRLLALDVGEEVCEKDMSISSAESPLKYDEERSGVMLEPVRSPLGSSMTILIEEFDFWRYTGGGLSGMHDWVCDPVLVLEADTVFSANANLSLELYRKYLSLWD